MATYTKEETPPMSTVGFTWESAFVYGSSRIGEERIDSNLIILANIQNRQNDNWYSYRNRGSKYFELGNHLGNVLATVSDRKLALDADGNKLVDGFDADIWTVNDYYPFGSAIPGRTFAASSEYRFGFNGEETYSEVNGSFNMYDFEARIYDPRLSRWLSLDPKLGFYQNETPYNFSHNSPIIFMDQAGEDPIIAFIDAITAFAVEAGLDLLTMSV